MNLAEKIRAAREAKQMTQKELAERLGLNIHSIHNWESGKHQPSPETLEKLQFVLQADLS